MSELINDRHYARMWPGWRALEDDTCLVCGLTYERESEQDRRLHRSRHRKVVQVYEPKADLAAQYAEHGAFVPISSHSPLRLRDRLGGMATMFRREFQFDFVPYSAAEDDRDAQHWLIVTPDGRPVGGFSARWDAPSWMWAWVWVIPSERRTGHVQRCWTMLKAKFPNIEPEPPFSYPIAKFFANRDDVSEQTRELAARRVARGPDRDED